MQYISPHWARLPVSRMGFGAWAIGSEKYGEHVAAPQALAALQRYYDRGGNFIDSARAYGDSEARIGQFLSTAHVWERVFVASKARSVRPGDVAPELEETLRNLGRDYVDLYYVHHPPEDPDQMHRLLDSFVALKEQGKIGAIGASVKGPDVTDGTIRLGRQYIDSGKLDVIQLIFSVLRQKNRALFAYAKAMGVGIVARTVLESGFLTGKYMPGHEFRRPDHRHRWHGERLHRLLAEVQELAAATGRLWDRTLAHASIRFAWEEPDIDCLIPGARDEAQVEGNTAVAEGPPIDPELKLVYYTRFAGRDEEFNTG